MSAAATSKHAIAATPSGPRTGRRHRSPLTPGGVHVDAASGLNIHVADYIKVERIKPGTGINPVGELASAFDRKVTANRQRGRRLLLKRGIARQYQITVRRHAGNGQNGGSGKRGAGGDGQRHLGQAAAKRQTGVGDAYGTHAKGLPPGNRGRYNRFKRCHGAIRNDEFLISGVIDINRSRRSTDCVGRHR